MLAEERSQCEMVFVELVQSGGSLVLKKMDENVIFHSQCLRIGRRVQVSVMKDRNKVNSKVSSHKLWRP